METPTVLCISGTYIPYPYRVWVCHCHSLSFFFLAFFFFSFLFFMYGMVAAICKKEKMIMIP